MSGLIIACGALARELRALLERQSRGDLRIRCLPAELHNRPEQIAPRLQSLLEAVAGDHDPVFVAYADCGSGGEIDRVLARFPGVSRLPGTHCYDIYAGAAQIENLLEEEPGSFFLTDFLVRHFDRLVWRGLGLDRFPHLLPLYFGNYRRVVYLAQTDDDTLLQQAQDCARRLGLDLDVRFTGYGSLGRVTLLPSAEPA